MQILIQKANIKIGSIYSSIGKALYASDRV
jgi:hypothetical protein